MLAKNQHSHTMLYIKTSITKSVLFLCYFCERFMLEISQFIVESDPIFYFSEIEK